MHIQPTASTPSVLFSIDIRTKRMLRRRRNSLRLKGYDYALPGEYFVTICTARRMCILGKVIDGRMRLSTIGKIVNECWRATPDHFPNTGLGAFQIMPNHLHGVVVIREKPGPPVPPVPVQHAAPGQGLKKPTPGSLSTIIRSFKSAVSKQVHDRALLRSSIWHRSFHDRIIRDEIEHFFVDRYIRLNPILWMLDSDNPDLHSIPLHELREQLRVEHALDDNSLDRAIRHETGYRAWRQQHP